MDNTNSLLIEYAKTYNTKEFISSDPIQFPHRFKEKKDIEISAFISSWLAYGNRKSILKTLEQLHKEFEKDYSSSPFEFIKNKGFEKYKDNQKSLYRFYKYNDYYSLCQVLYLIYIKEESPSLEDKIKKTLESKENKNPTCLDIIDTIINLFKEVEGIPINNKSACKRLCMLLRWLVRNDKIVDLGLWTILKPQDLIIPVDTHVHQQALNLNITKSKQANMKTAIEITSYLKTVFPQDPTLADFALFGYGVKNNQ